MSDEIKPIADGWERANKIWIEIATIALEHSPDKTRALLRELRDLKNRDALVIAPHMDIVIPPS